MAEYNTSPVYTHGKTVELLELFNDLIYVYAISQMTSLLHYADNGIGFAEVFQYLMACLVVLQAWLFQTNYVNRFGRHSWPEHVVVCINMIAVLFLTNTISSDWETVARPFAISMCAMFASTVLLYFMHSTRSEPGTRFARNVASMLVCFAFVYLVITIAAPLLPAGVLTIVLPVMVVAGAIVPSLVKEGFDPAFVDAGHLVERFELLVILTFGETIVALTELFDVMSFSLVPILVFLNVVLLFGTYVIFVHRMLDHHLKEQRGLTFMYTHFAMVIGLNLLTVAMPLVNERGEQMLGLTIMAISSVLFYAALLMDNVYAKQGFVLTMADIAVIATAVLVGLLVSAIAREISLLLLLGVLLTRVGVFGVVLYRYTIGTKRSQSNTYIE